MKRKIAIGIVVLFVILFVSGTTILALATTPGTQEDPFITLSYLTDVFKAQMLEDAKKTGQELTEKFDSRIAELETQLQSSSGEANASRPKSADVFSVVTLSNGQTLTCSVGVEIMLRVGSANGFGTAPALVNYTDGTTLPSGSALTTNHMYLVTIEGNGIKATAATVKVLARGNYKIT